MFCYNQEQCTKPTQAGGGLWCTALSALGGGTQIGEQISQTSQFGLS